MDMIPGLVCSAVVQIPSKDFAEQADHFSPTPVNNLIHIRHLAGICTVEPARTAPPSFSISRRRVCLAFPLSLQTFRVIQQIVFSRHPLVQSLECTLVSFTDYRIDSQLQALLKGSLYDLWPRTLLYTTVEIIACCA